MTKPWHPRVIPGGRSPTRNLVGKWDRHRWPMPGQKRRKRRRAEWREILAVVVLGLVIGLAVALLWPRGGGMLAEKQPRITAPRADPYAESRRSRAILEAQEGRPAPMRIAQGRAAPGDAVRAQPAFVRVIDGDTFDYRGDRIRVADIDTPEREGRCPYETMLAARATARMRALLAAGPFELHAAPDGRDEDRYGRKLRIVTRGGRSLGDQLVAEGLARTWSGRREPWC